MARKKRLTGSMPKATRGLLVIHDYSPGDGETTGLGGCEGTMVALSLLTDAYLERIVPVLAKVFVKLWAGAGVESAHTPTIVATTLVQEGLGCLNPTTYAAGSAVAYERAVDPHAIYRLKLGEPVDVDVEGGEEPRWCWWLEARQMVWPDEDGYSSEGTMISYGGEDVMVKEVSSKVLTEYLADMIGQDPSTCTAVGATYDECVGFLGCMEMAMGPLPRTGVSKGWFDDTDGMW